MPFFVQNTQAKIHDDQVSIMSNYAIVYHLNDDRILYEKNANDKIYPASMTKIMTTLVAIEAMKEDTTFVIQAEALEGLTQANASVAGFQVNEKVTYTDLLYGILLPSGADATRSIAISVFGSEEALVAKMNEKAKALHMDNTHFVNTSGLHDDNHYSSVNDIAILLKEALKNDLFKQIFCAKSYTTTNQRLTFHSTMQSQAQKSGIDVSMISGAKTGFTLEASLCLASYASKDGQEFVMVSAKPNIAINVEQDLNETYQILDSYHIRDAQTMYNYLFSHYKSEVVLKKKEEIGRIRLRYASKDTYAITMEKDLSLLLSETEKANLKVVFTPYEERFDAPLYPLTTIGELTIYQGKEKLYEQEVQYQTKISQNKIAYYSRHIDVLLYDFRYLLVVLGAGFIAFLVFEAYKSKKK